MHSHAERMSCFFVRFSTVFFCLGAVLVGANKDRHVVLVSIDGFPARLWNDPDVSIPNLRKLAADGARAEAMTTSNPSVTWPSHTTMVTGVTPRKHGVLANGLIIRQGPGKPPTIEPWVDKPKLVFATTLYDLAHAAGLTSAESDWVAITRAKTINWSFAELPDPDGKVEREMIAAGVATREDFVAMGMGPNRRKVQFRDEMWTRAACFMFKQHAPNLLLYHTLTTDSTHHRFGAGSDPSLTALAFADRLLGDLVRTVEASGRRDRTTFIVTTDHGFKKVDKYVYPNVAFKQAGLIQVAGPTITRADAYVLPLGGMGLVYVTDPARQAELLPKLKELLGRTEGIARVIDAQDAHSLGMPKPGENAGMGELILYPKDGHAFSAAATGPKVVGPAVNYGGSHGYHNGDPELDGIFVASGAGIKKGMMVDRVSNLDIAPTIARILGLDLGPVDGRVLENILTAP